MKSTLQTKSTPGKITLLPFQPLNSADFQTSGDYFANEWQHWCQMGTVLAFDESRHGLTAHSVPYPGASQFHVEGSIAKARPIAPILIGEKGWKLWVCSECNNKPCTCEDGAGGLPTRNGRTYFLNPPSWPSPNPFAVVNFSTIFGQWAASGQDFNSDEDAAAWLAIRWNVSRSLLRRHELYGVELWSRCPWAIPGGQYPPAYSFRDHHTTHRSLRTLGAVADAGEDSPWYWVAPGYLVNTGYSVVPMSGQN